MNPTRMNERLDQVLQDVKCKLNGKVKCTKKSVFNRLHSYESELHLLENCFSNMIGKHFTGESAESRGLD